MSCTSFWTGEVDIHFRSVAAFFLERCINSGSGGGEGIPIDTNRGGSRILRRRGRQSSREGVPTNYFPKFSEKLREIEKILDRRGSARRERRPPLDRPLTMLLDPLLCTTLFALICEMLQSSKMYLAVVRNKYTQ